jgi:DNA-binding MarR family transcriptional regulator
MNAQFFSAKRAHHGILGFTRKPLARFGLTAARFDMLYAIENGGCFQNALRRKLGVTAPVVSRMLKSLEALGLIRRKRAHDRRTRLVSLTVQGARRLRKCLRKVAHEKRAPYRTLLRAITFGKLADPEACFWATCQLDDLLRGIRREFGDSATLHYPWHPDD